MTNERTGIEVTETGPYQLRLEARLAPEDVKRARKRTLDEYRRHIDLPGFRKGKVPDRILEKRLGDRLELEVKERIVSDTVKRIVEERRLSLLRNPRVRIEQVEFDADGGARFGVDLELRPEFDLPDLTGIRVGAPPVRVTDEQVDAEMENLRKQRARPVKIESGVCAPGDILEVDVGIQIDDALVLERKDQVADTSSGTIGAIPVGDAIAALHGKSVGGSAIIPARLPDDFEPSGFAGAEANLLCTIKAIHRRQEPELDDAFAQELGAESLDDLRQKVREMLLERAKAERDRFVEERIFDELLRRVDVPLPPRLLDEAVDETLSRMVRQLVERGADEAEARAQAAARSEEVRREEERALRISLLLERIAERENVRVSDRELEDAVRALARNFGVEPAEMARRLEESGGFGSLYSRVLERKIRRLLREKATIEEAALDPGTSEEAGGPGGSAEEESSG